MAAKFWRIIALAVFISCGLWVSAVFDRSDMITQAGGFQATLWRPLVWAALLALVWALVRWRRQWERLMLVILTFIVIGLAMQINNPDVLAGISSVVIPTAWWIFWFTLAEATLVLLSAAFVLKPRRPQRWRKPQKGGEVSAA